MSARVPVEWTKENAQVAAKLLQPCSFGSAHRVADGKAEETLCTAPAGKQRVSLLKMFNVGHAWPAGSGDTSFGGGNWMRACIGRQFALQEATLILSMLLQRFELIDFANYHLETKQTLTIKPNNAAYRRPPCRLVIGAGQRFHRAAAQDGIWRR